MLIFQEKKFIKTPFNNEAELETVVVNNYEYLFGPDSFYLPKTLIKTADGSGTIPDGFAIDINQKQWYIVEAELGHHDVWNHIAKQVSKQLVASQQTTTKRKLEEVAIDVYNSNSSIKEKFNNLSISSVDARKVIRDILETDPIIGIPIDHIPNDLRDWAKQQKYKVKLWLVNKYIELGNSSNIIFEFPEEFKPTVDTTEPEKPKNNTHFTKSNIELSDLIAAGFLKVNDPLIMYYKPKNGIQKKYEAIVHEDGSLSILGQLFSSPSYAALAGIKDAGSDRQTVNGWTSWRTAEGISLYDLREKLMLMPAS
ncbi:DUF4357 domain-containing protein [Hymenobacter edaphi]|uniref:restriction system modified-DNA reader domain-containing protein n=1 Tax=Hymenobacter edaphi TaxID=2211146 RepID=UPI001057F8B6|nr:DUF4357 domain-containing protein [Hymenobacter edaphi]